MSVYHLINLYVIYLQVNLRAFVGGVLVMAIVLASQVEITALSTQATQQVTVCAINTLVGPMLSAPPSSATVTHGHRCVCPMQMVQDMGFVYRPWK